MSDPEPRWERIWPEFEKQLKAKLARGYEEHTDMSFAKTPEDLLRELIEEVIDICGWSLVLYARLSRMIEQVEDVRLEVMALQQEVMALQQERDGKEGR